MKTKILLVALLVSLGFFSCQKGFFGSDNLSPQENAAITDVVGTMVNSTLSTDIQTLGTNEMTSLGKTGQIGNGIRIGNFPMFGPMFKMSHLSDCATVTVSNTGFPKVLTIDFGTSCTDNKGMARTGKITIEMSDTIIAAGAVYKTTFQDVYFGNTKVEFTGTSKNTGKNEKGNWVIENSATQTITKDNGDTRTHTSAGKIEWTSGFDTPDRTDDVFYTTGSGTVTLADGTTFSKTITTPLLFDAACGYAISGVVDLVNADGKTTIDYGTGNCDNIATLTNPDGSTTEIDIRSCRLGKENRQGKGGKRGHCGKCGGNESKSWFGF